MLSYMSIWNTTTSSIKVLHTPIRSLVLAAFFTYSVKFMYYKRHILWKLGNKIMSLSAF